MINRELIETSRLLVAAVQESQEFSAEYLRKLVLHFVPLLLGEIEILAAIAESRTMGLAEALDLPDFEVTVKELEKAPEPAPSTPKGKKKKPNRSRRRGRK